MECFLIKKIQKFAKTYPEQIALIEFKDNLSISYSELYERIYTLGNKLKGLNLSNKLCILFFPAGIEATIVIMSCFFAGIIPIIRTINPNSTNERFEHQFYETLNAIKEVSAVISYSDIFDLQNVCQQNNIAFFNYNKLDEYNALTQSNKIIDADLIQMTSGSTSIAKCIKISFDNMQKNLDLEVFVREINNNSVTCTWSPQSHPLGLYLGLCLPLYTGGTSIIIAPSEISNEPLLLLKAITKYKVTHTAITTSMLNTCLIAFQKSNIKLDLHSLKKVTIAGEAIKYDVLINFLQTFEKFGFDFSIFSPSYGMTENAGTICSITKNDKFIAVAVDGNELTNNKVVESNEPDSIKLVSVGTPIWNTPILVVDDKFNILPELNIGEILFNSPSLTKGYLNPSDNKSFITIKNNKNIEETFFRTGDLGFIKDGQLIITGRLKEIIVIHGKKYSPVDVENIAKKIDKNSILGENAAFVYESKNNEEVILFQELTASIDDTNKNILKQEIISTVKSKINLTIDNVIFFKQNEIPRTSSGKIQRLLCREKYKNKSR